MAFYQLNLRLVLCTFYNIWRRQFQKYSLLQSPYSFSLALCRIKPVLIWILVAVWGVDVPQGHIDDYICMNSEEITLSSAAWSCQPVLWSLSEVYYFIFHLDFFCLGHFQAVKMLSSMSLWLFLLVLFVCLSLNSVNNGSCHSDFNRRYVLLYFIMACPFDLHSVFCPLLIW